MASPDFKVLREIKQLVDGAVQLMRVPSRKVTSCRANISVEERVTAEYVFWFALLATHQEYENRLTLHARLTSNHISKMVGCMAGQMKHLGF